MHTLNQDLASLVETGKITYETALSKCSDANELNQRGITTVDNYANFGATVAFNFWLGKYARLNLGTHLRTQTQHFINV